MSTNLVLRSKGADYAMSGPCATCGFTPGLTPSDSMEALLAFPAKWRATLALDLEAPDPTALLTGRATPGGWSPLEHAGHVRDVIHALDLRVHRVFTEENPTLPETHVTPAAGANEQGSAVVLAALTVSADQLAGTIQHARPEAWSRVACRTGSKVTALDLIAEAVHEGVHHLHLAEGAIAKLRSRRAPASSPA